MTRRKAFVACVHMSNAVCVYLPPPPSPASPSLSKKFICDLWRPTSLLLSDGHAEAELVVLVGVVNLGGEHEGEARVEALLQEGGHHPVVVDPAAE
jgi:hypothetical protein